MSAAWRLNIAVISAEQSAKDAVRSVAAISLRPGWRKPTSSRADFAAAGFARCKTRGNGVGLARINDEVPSLSAAARATAESPGENVFRTVSPMTKCAGDVFVDIGLAIDAAQPVSRLRVDHIELVGGVLAFGGIAGDAILVVTMHAGADRLCINRMIGLGEAAGEFVQRIVLVQMQHQRDQRHAHRHAVGGLLEIDRAAVAVERRVELVDARQRVHDAGVGILGFAEEFCVDLRIGQLLAGCLVGPAFLLEAGDINGVGFLLRAVSRSRLRARHRARADAAGSR